ncbi:uncharacterized protein RAG0_10912 [Rhynchosporium agropyri]|uniref:Uncharacterized protein n=1 Tax=Rhynchosporium agropyri TaxID=914238 RepID=A0A1E1L1U8_9HELO|nr:uncharacterized protein RAG0_10912 [Rhynchosporium agropyri]
MPEFEFIDDVQVVLKDLLDRFSADVESALRRVKLGTQAGKIIETIDTMYERMRGHLYDRAERLIAIVGRRHTFLILNAGGSVLAGLIDQLTGQLCNGVEVRLTPTTPSGPKDHNILRSSYPYRPNPAYNKYRPAPSSPIFTYSRKKVVPVPAPVILGEGPGPKPIPVKAKVNLSKKWNVGVWDTENIWAASENWEDLMLHLAYKDRLDAEKVQKAKEVAKGGAKGKGKA